MRDGIRIVSGSGWLHLMAACWCLIAAGNVRAAEWTPDAGASTVTMYASKQGTSFSGVFDRFSATIDFDLAAPAAGRIIGIVRTDSFRTDDSQNDTYVRGYLEVEAFPEARFESSSIEKTAEGFRASGELTLKGITRQATLDFAFTTDPAAGDQATAARFQGLMTINRFDFDVAADVDTSWAGQDVTVAIDLILER